MNDYFNINDDQRDVILNILKKHVFPDKIGAFTSSGISKRELFAAMAMQGLIAGGLDGRVDIANESVLIADALIKALEENND